MGVRVMYASNVIVLVHLAVVGVRVATYTVTKRFGKRLHNF